MGHLVAITIYYLLFIFHILFSKFIYLMKHIGFIGFNCCLGFYLWIYQYWFILSPIGGYFD